MSCFGQLKVQNETHQFSDHIWPWKTANPLISGVGSRGFIKNNCTLFLYVVMCFCKISDIFLILKVFAASEVWKFRVYANISPSCRRKENKFFISWSLFIFTHYNWHSLHRGYHLSKKKCGHATPSLCLHFFVPHHVLHFCPFLSESLSVWPCVPSVLVCGNWAHLTTGAYV